MAFIVRIYHDARSSECQTVPSSLPLLRYAKIANVTTLTCMSEDMVSNHTNYSLISSRKRLSRLYCIYWRL